MNIWGTDKEQQILRLFRRGDASAMDMLYAEYAGYLTGVCSRYIPDDDDLEDVLQESFIKIFTSIDSFKYQGRGSLKAWLTRIAVNESLQQLRRQKVSPIGQLGDTDPPDSPDEEPDTESLDSDTIFSLIRQLPPGYREVLNLFAIEGKSHKEIGQMLGIKPSTSASQFNRAKNMLARMINDYKRNRDK